MYLEFFQFSSKVWRTSSANLVATPCQSCASDTPATLCRPPAPHHHMLPAMPDGRLPPTQPASSCPPHPDSPASSYPRAPRAIDPAARPSPVFVCATRCSTSAAAPLALTGLDRQHRPANQQPHHRSSLVCTRHAVPSRWPPALACPCTPHHNHPSALPRPNLLAEAFRPLARL